MPHHFICIHHKIAPLIRMQTTQYKRGRIRAHTNLSHPSMPTWAAQMKITQHYSDNAPVLQLKIAGRQNYFVHAIRGFYLLFNGAHCIVLFFLYLSFCRRTIFLEIVWHFNRFQTFVTRNLFEIFKFRLRRITWCQLYIRVIPEI